MQHRSSEIAGSRVRIVYAVELNFEVIAPTDFIFNIHASRTPQQSVTGESFVTTPAVPVRVDDDPTFGNRLGRLHAEPGPLNVRYAATADVSHYTSEPSLLFAVPPAELPPAVLRYLRPSRYCQSDRVSSLAWQQFGHLAPGYEQAQAVCTWVRQRTRFQPGTSGVNTSALDTLDAGVGVCRDFAHAAISLLRALNYPTRIVTGVDYGADPGLGPPDFHCYLDVFLGDRWYLFDPTGICPLTGLIRIATGSDAADVSFATTFGQVRGTMPKLSFTAVEDVAAGIMLPYPTSLAISTVSVL
ncbi:MAG: transglutaminase family protein [Betaproteobacteria bacterium]|nr:MAG: transglutaminase family protein [Betaproteobacteria bacterium]